MLLHPITLKERSSNPIRVCSCEFYNGAGPRPVPYLSSPCLPARCSCEKRLLLKCLTGTWLRCFHDILKYLWPPETLRPHTGGHYMLASFIKMLGSREGGFLQIKSDGAVNPKCDNPHEDTRSQDDFLKKKHDFYVKIIYFCG